MSYQATVINVMIASPSDVPQDRQLIQTIIHEWNSMHAERRRSVLMPIMWETHSTPEMGARPQSIVNRQVLARCDLLIAVFWTRLGSPTGESPSGTVEEIRKHLAAGKPAMIYFSNNPVSLDTVDTQQIEALKAFRAECQPAGLLGQYDSPGELRTKLSRDLVNTVQTHFPVGAITGGPSEPAQGPAPGAGLSDDAKQLLTTAASDDGDVMCIGTQGGYVIQAGHQRMAKQGDRREEARWKAALEQLVQSGLLKDRGYKGEMFEVTHGGYELAELLKAEAQPGK